MNYLLMGYCFRGYDDKRFEMETTVTAKQHGGKDNGNSNDKITVTAIYAYEIGSKAVTVCDIW